ncbi:hypothetical protein BP6252_08720 [Coleophoma cylindrospora]|uniref:Poly A polymerase head domain-containing protein n=1 Tax=Coleophoma cylindrospora TaxID=1849047 RepID=A0A3D8R6W9_9HELO|nr:hypothetical protein BP6252_08720 [Coleophoma cylindrospora]
MASFTRTKIELNEQESKLRNLLLDVARYIDESKEIKDALELRFAGGWVRDKILGIPSHDIDVAINAMTGYPFSLKLKEYLEIPGNLEKYAITSNDVGNLHKIAANPEKSKHLETVTVKMIDLDVDLVNLRKETYSEDSRNPQMEFGTAEEDALRRDATINALFYNLHTGEVEDFTGGLLDMESQLIRTPLEPHQTFMDDPLRVLRLVRFASRLNFHIDATSELSMSEPSVLEALRMKISRERVGTELEKMLKGKGPRDALQFIDRLGLYSTIFTDPHLKPIPAPDSSRLKLSYECLENLRVNETPGSIYQSLVRSDDARYFAWILAALTPWSQIPGEVPIKPGGRATIPYAAMVAKEGIKANNKICSVVTGALRNYIQITELKNAINNEDARISERDTIGMQIRRWDFLGGHWRLQALFALLVEASNSTEQEGYGKVFAEWQRFVEHLEKLEVMDAPSIRPIIDGKQLTKELGVRPGIWMAPALDVCMEWQLRNPGETDFAGAVEEVRKRKDELKIPLK